MRTFTFLMTLLVVLSLSSCVNESTTPFQPSPTITTHTPKGTISGKVVDNCTNAAVKGAVISLGYDGAVHQVTSDVSGSFSFANVPATQVTNTAGIPLITGVYNLTVCMSDCNRAQKDTMKLYRENYYIAGVPITFTTLTPGDSLGIEGLAGSAEVRVSAMNTRVNGVVLDENQKPVSGAIVRLWNFAIGSIIAQTTSGADGSYSFAKVDNGIAIDISALSADGTLRGQLGTPYNLPCNAGTVFLSGQVANEQLVLHRADNVPPYVISIDPMPNADIQLTGAHVSYLFSKPILQNAYTNVAAPPGAGAIIDDISVQYSGMKLKTTAAIPFTLAWDATFTTLTVTPVSLAGSAKYSVDAHIALAKLRDNAKNALVPNPDPTFIGDVLPHTSAVQFTTKGNSTTPAVPNLVRRFIVGTYSSLDYSGGPVGLQWNYDANAGAYNVYKSYGNGPFQLLHNGYKSITDADNTGSLVIASPGSNNPLGATFVRYCVRAISKDLVESPASDTITVSDNVKPVFNPGVSVDSAGSNKYYYVSVPFREPLVLATAENIGNFSFSNTLTPMPVIKADYLGANGAAGPWWVLLTVSGRDNSNFVEAPLLTVSTAVTDLNGNSMETDNSGNKYQAPFPLPGIDSISVRPGLAPRDSIQRGQPFLLHVYGTNFTAKTMLFWYTGSRTDTLAPTVISRRHLTYQTTPSQVDTARVIIVRVMNPLPGGGISSSKQLVISNPKPFLAALDRSSAKTGDTTLIITVTGTDFVFNSFVMWNGSPLDIVADRPNTSTSISATVPSSYLNSMGIAKITVGSILANGTSVYLVSDSTKLFNIMETFQEAWVGSPTAPPGWSTLNSNWKQLAPPYTGALLAPIDSSFGTIAWFNTRGQTARLITPAFDLSRSKLPQLTFNYLNVNGTDKLNILVSKDGGITWDAAIVKDTTGSAWSLQVVSLPAKANVKIAFEGSRDGGTSDLFIDNVQIVQ